MGGVEIHRSRIRALVNVQTREALDDKALEILRNCREECPVQTGTLMRSHQIERVSEDKRIISANAPYARSVFDGDQSRRPNRWMLRGLDRSRV